MHVLSDVVDTLLHLLQHDCRGLSSRHASRVPTLIPVLHILQLHPYCSWIERHWCSVRPSAIVWVALEVAAVDVSQFYRESPPQAGSSVWTAMERVAMAANLVAFCCSTEPSEKLNACPPNLQIWLANCTAPPSLGRPTPTAAHLLVVLQLETLVDDL